VVYHVNMTEERKYNDSTGLHSGGGD